ncbi:MAG: DUF4238 domain-containing protein [Bellilinea sp.]
MQQITHDNHFVPQLYLKQWSDDGLNVWSYRTLVSHERVPEWVCRPIRGVACQRDLYTTYENGVEVDDFEKWLEEEFEKPVQKSLRKVLKDNSLSALDWERLAAYLGAQDVRTPLSYLESMERWSNTLPKLLHETLEKSVHEFGQMQNLDENVHHSPTTDNQFFEKAVSIQIHPSSESDTEQAYIRADIVAGRALWLESQKFLLTKTIKVLQGHKWSIVHPAQGYQWFTCDHPVVRLNYYGDDKYDLKGGWGNKGANILMPISPRHLLFTQIGDELQDRFTLTTVQTKEIQQFIAERSLRWVFAHRPLKIISKLRPRHIDPEAYNREKEQWEKWHELQSQTENKST